MLRIKENADLNILINKYGFVDITNYFNISNYVRELGDPRVLELELEKDIYSNDKNITIIIYALINKKSGVTDTFSDIAIGCDDKKWTDHLDVLYDLIADGLVEKVDDE